MNPLISYFQDRPQSPPRFYDLLADVTIDPDSGLYYWMKYFYVQEEALEYRQKCLDYSLADLCTGEGISLDRNRHWLSRAPGGSGWAVSSYVANLSDLEALLVYDQPKTIPTAGIQAITPSSITQGDGNVTFDGSASAATTPGASITTYRWTSSIDGQLYEGGNASFSRDSTALSLGQHTISLQVRDSDGLWNQNSTQGALYVYEPGPDEGHDLLVSSINLDQDTVAVNSDLAVDVMVNNAGDHTEGAFTIMYTLKNQSGGTMDQETVDPSWTLTPGQTKGPGWVYLTPSSGYEGPARIEVTVNTSLDEDRANNDATASGYVGSLPAYDGYYGASWNWVPGGSDVVEGSYNIYITDYYGDSVRLVVEKGGDSWSARVYTYNVELFDQNRLAVAYYGRNSSPTYYGLGVFPYNESAVWLTDEHVSTYEGEQCEFIVNRQSSSSTYASGWDISSSGDGTTVRTWPHDDERIDSTTRRITITPPNDAAGHYDFWLANAWSWGGSTYDGTTKRLDNGLGVMASLTVYADDAPSTVINSGPTGTNAQDSANFTYGGSDDRTPTASLTYSYRLVGYQDSWSSYGSATSKSYSDLPNGSYTFEVRAKDGKGQVDSSPAQRVFAVDVQSAPGTPVNTTPQHQASMRAAQDIDLHGSVFSDADPGASHAATEFRSRSDAGSYSSPAWTSGTLGGTTSVSVAAGELTGGDSYWWQCRYKDDTDRWSEWSGETSITVAQNHAPSAYAQNATVVHDRSTAISLPVSDQDGDSVTCQIVGTASHGTATISNGAATATYTPVSAYVGADEFTYRVSDGLADSSVATVAVTVVNHDPQANSIMMVVETDSRTTLNLPGADADGDFLTYVVESGPDHGSLFVNNIANGQVDYQSTAGYDADDSLSYSVTDGIASKTGTVSLVVSDPDNMSIELVRDALGNLGIKHPAIAGYTYTVQYCASLTNGWTDLLSGQIGDGTVWTTLDTTEPLPACRFYRVMIHTP